MIENLTLPANRHILLYQMCQTINANDNVATEAAAGIESIEAYLAEAALATA